MCVPGQPAVPATAADAVAMARAGLAWLAGADATSLAAETQADCLRALEQAESMHTAARATILSAFAARAGFEADGHGSAKTWLRWQTQITGGAAAGAMAWMRRLAGHPAVQAAMAAGNISASWARQVCDWTDQLPADNRPGADVILLAAAAGGAELSDLARLADQMRQQTARPDSDDDGFDDRSVQLDVTFGAAGRLAGDLTPQCTAALAAVLESLGNKAGPEDLRSKRQRHHDALEEACRRLIAADCLPDRAGQPTQIQLHMTLDQLRGLAGAAEAEGALGARGGTGSSPDATPTAPPWPAARPGDDCDAAIVPLVTGHVDHDLLDKLAGAFLDRAGARRWRAERVARQIIVRHAADLLSGPGGLAACLRTRLPENIAASVSLPLDIGAVTETIPVHLRRAVTARDRHCRFPGCDQPPAACQPHHVVHRSAGGPTSLVNMLLLCSFHHLIAVHRWGWGIALHPDGTVTATSPDGTRTLHSHSPPATAA
jgi:hypothetical protein